MMTGSPAVFVVLLSLYVAPVLISQLGVRCSCLIGLLALGIAIPAHTLGNFMGKCWAVRCSAGAVLCCLGRLN